MRIRHVMAFLWDRTWRVTTIPDGAPDPTQAELDAIAAQLLVDHDLHQDGVVPDVRVVQSRSTRSSTVDP